MVNLKLIKIMNPIFLSRLGLVLSLASIVVDGVIYHLSSPAQLATAIGVESAILLILIIIEMNYMLFFGRISIIYLGILLAGLFSCAGVVLGINSISTAVGYALSSGGIPIFNYSAANASLVLGLQNEKLIVSVKTAYLLCAMFFFAIYAILHSLVKEAANHFLI